MGKTFADEIWNQNYRYKNEKKIEDTWRRIAKNGAIFEDEKIKDKIENKFYEILSDFKFIPGGRIMANIGTDRKSTTLLNCFVHNPGDLNYKDPDSLEGIYEMLKAQAHTLKSEGGYGMNFSWIRPRGAYIKGIDTRTPGVLKFMELWDKSSEIITLGSDKITSKKKDIEKKKIRKGAMMALLSIWHPEVIDFIKAKQTPNRLTKFNMSVGIDGDFMNRVINEEKWQLKYPDLNHEKYEEEWNGNIFEWEKKGYPVIIYEEVNAKELWDLIMYSTYTRNEPGVLFFDIANKLNPLYYNEFLQAGNPCAEILMPTGACNLGSLNLVKFIKKEPNFDGHDEFKFSFDFDKYKEVIKYAIRFLDNINDVSNTPLKEYKKSMVEKRRIGLGNMGLGSLHFMLGMQYGSDESIEFIKNIYKVKSETEILSSAELALEKGSFPQFSKEKYFNSFWWKNLKINDEIKNKIEKIGEMRNSHRSMNAPNGNTSVYAGVVSGGIEPVFMKEYIRWTIVSEYERRKLIDDGMKFPDVYNGEWYETEHFKFKTKGDEEILEGSFNGKEYEIDKNRGLVKSSLVEDHGWKWVKKNYSLDEISEMEENNIFKTTHELSISDHIRVLKTVSHYTDQNNSKTVNLSNDYPYEEFKNLYIDAWKSNIKGLTTYREGSMTAVLEEKKKIEKYQNELDELFDKHNGNIIFENVKLPNEYYSKGYKIKDKNKKKWYIHIAFADSGYKKPFALFVNTNAKESSEVADEVIHNMEKLLLSKGINDELLEIQRNKYLGQTNITKIARSIGMALRHNIRMVEVIQVLDQYDVEFSSFIFHLKKLLSKFIKDGTQVKKEKCLSCNSKNTMTYQEGCKICIHCGWSAC